MHIHPHLNRLPKIFTFQEENIKNFLSKELPNILNQKEIKDKINNFKNLKQFLGKKRNKQIDKEELFKIKITLKILFLLKKLMIYQLIQILIIIYVFKKIIII